MALIDKLTAIGDAIRNKTGKTDLLALDEMVAEIEGIEGGISLEDIIQKSGITSIKTDATVFNGYTFFGWKDLKSIDAPNCKITNIGELQGCINLEVVNMPQLEDMNDDNCFADCSKLTTIYLPELWRMNDGTFINCTSLKNVYLPKAAYLGSNSFMNTGIESVSFPLVNETYSTPFRNCNQLRLVDLGTTLQLQRGVFQFCPNLKVVILRGSEISTLSGVSDFNKSPFEIGGTGGTVYVPAALVEEYKVATNWSVLYEAGTCDFVAIEGSEYE
jgi:hypothetical protein